MSAVGLGRAKTLGREEHVERRSSPATMSSQAMASPLGNRGTGRTRFPSVDALSEFLHGQGHVWTAPLRQVLSWHGDDCGRVQSCVWPVGAAILHDCWP